jgi:hypothetical protein
VTVKSERKKEMSKPTRVLVQEEDLHTAAEPKELDTQYLILDIAQCVREGQEIPEWLLNELRRLAKVWTF